ncbi:MAG TPA: shikimate dehydrogenase [Symbiobacteriaceae bacterium]|nr:shikimate dehydrogenase [Symbiobacteriaceae bacterium]
MQGRFAFTVHPTDISFVHRRWPITRRVPTRLTERLLSFKGPFKVSDIVGVQTPYNSASGLFVAIPYTTRMWHDLPEELLVRRVVEACQIAERHGARIIGLGAHSAIPGDAGREIARRVGIPVTTGNTYTVAAALEAVLQGARLMGKEISKARVAIVGAAGSIGACCVRILARDCTNLVLVGRSADRLADLRDKVLTETGTLCHIATDLKATLPMADVVIAVSSAMEAIIDPADLKPGAVVCDVAIPRDVDHRVAEARKDVLVIDGGLIAVPGNLRLGYDVGLPPGIAWACLSETMLLALEERYEPFTLGRDLSVAKVDEIRALARKHGFRLAQMRSFHRPVTELDIQRIRRNVAKTVERS